MPINFNALNTGGPQGVYQGFMQGQQLQNKMLADQQALEAQRQTQQLNALKMRGVEQDYASKVRAEKANMFKEGLLRAATPDAARTLIKRQYSDPDLGPFLQQSIPLEDALAEISDDPTQFEKFKMQEAMGMPAYLKSQELKVTPTGDVWDPVKREFIRKPTAAAPKLVSVIGPNGPVLVPADQAAGMTPFNATSAKIAGLGGLGGAGGAKPLTAAQQLKQRKDMAADQSRITNADATANELERLTDQLVGNVDKNIAAHPGLSGITGWNALLPSAPRGKAREAQQKLETFKGKIKALGRQLMTQDGKLGNMAVQEWKFVADAVQNIDPAADNLDEQMRDVVRQARDFAERLRGNYGTTYESADGELPASGGRSSAGKQADPLGIR